MTIKAINCLETSYPVADDARRTPGVFISGNDTQALIDAIGEVLHESRFSAGEPQPEHISRLVELLKALEDSQQGGSSIETIQVKA